MSMLQSSLSSFKIPEKDRIVWNRTALRLDWKKVNSLLILFERVYKMKWNTERVKPANLKQYNMLRNVCSIHESIPLEHTCSNIRSLGGYKLHCGPFNFDVSSSLSVKYSQTGFVQKRTWSNHCFQPEHLSLRNILVFFFWRDNNLFLRCNVKLNNLFVGESVMYLVLCLDNES